MTSTRVPALVVAGAVGLAGLGVGVVIGPAAASAATSSATHAVTDRVTAIKDALAGLVKDGTLTQAQADKVATTLDDKLPVRGPHGPGMVREGLDDAAKVIGISGDELRTQLQSGKSLAEVAKSHGVSEDTLVTRLVASAKSHLADAVKAGRLTQAQADRMTADLSARITRMVTSTPRFGGPGRHGGPDGRWSEPPNGSGSGSSTSPSTSSSSA